MVNNSIVQAQQNSQGKACLFRRQGVLGGWSHPRLWNEVYHGLRTIPHPPRFLLKPQAHSLTCLL